MKPIRWPVAILLVALCAAARGAAADPLDAGLPTTRLFDTGASLTDPMPARPPTGSWQAVPEGDVAHAFRADAVALNDRVALVARPGGRGVELYSRGADGLSLRAMLSPPSGDGIRQVRISENAPSAVALNVAFGDTALTFRITTGDVKAEVRGDAGLTVRCEARRAVVPDFFANDMVFGADSFEGGRLGLPAENFFLGLLGGGDCMLMTVWDTPGRDADLLAAATETDRAVVGWEVAGAEGGRTWVAVLEGVGMWHEGAMPAAGGLSLDWAPPFPAKWRADLLTESPLARSLALATGEDDEEAEAATCACSVADGRTLLDMTAEAAGRVVVYPIDRSRATPLNAFCPIDIVRSALGVGPCQYILAMEGMDREAQPTPADVTHHVERQFKRGREQRREQEIRELLDRMVEHVAHSGERIARYREFAGEVRGACAGEQTAAAALLARTADDMERAVEGADATARQEARRLADEIAALIGQENAYEACAKLGAELRAVGAVQDRALAGGRMAVRWLRQQCRTAAAGDPNGAALAARLQARAEEMLAQK